MHLCVIVPQVLKALVSKLATFDEYYNTQKYPYKQMKTNMPSR